MNETTGYIQDKLNAFVESMTMLDSANALAMMTDNLLGQIEIIESSLGLVRPEVGKCPNPVTMGECLGQSRSNVGQAQDRLARIIDALGRVDIPASANALPRY